MWVGTAPGVATVGELAARVEQRLGRAPLVIGQPDMPVGRVVWCTGAAQGMLQHAVDAGATVYITGEASEPTTHLARETGTAFIGAGHHATERYGVQALGAAIAERFGIAVHFVDIDNPV
jgi:putative NIF3 family GTP cyclohydrolase 1 type 2